MNGEVPPPLLLRRRLSVPEIVMRKYSLAQRANNEEDNNGNTTARNSSSLPRKKPNKKGNYRRVNFWKNSNLNSNRMDGNVDYSSVGKKQMSTELNVISNVRLSQPTLDLIFKEILKEARIGFANRDVEETIKEDVAKEIISNVNVGSPYGIPLTEVTSQCQTTVPRYSATPRTSSMEVNASSSGNENGSDSDTFVDSLEDLSNLLSPPLPDNSESIKPKLKPSFPAFFVPIETLKVAKPTGNISELLPAKVKEKLFARQEKRQKKHTETPKSTFPKVGKDIRPTEPSGTKRFVVKPKRFGLPKRRPSSKVIVEEDNSKSKIPVSATPNLPKIIDGKSKKTTKIPVRRTLDSKVDRLIANILIDTLNKQDSEERGQSSNNKKKESTSTSVPHGWSSFYMLHKHPESPESTSDEGMNTSRKVRGNSKRTNDTYNSGRRRQPSPINEWSVTVEGSYVPDVEMRLRFHRTDRRRKVIEQKNFRDVRLPAMQLPSHAVNNERWLDDTSSKMSSTKVVNRRDTMPTNKRLQPVRGLEGVLAESQLSAILRKFPGLLSVNGSGILPEKNSIHHV